MTSQATDSSAPGMFQIGFRGEVKPQAVLAGVPVEPSDTTTIRIFDDAPTELTVDEPIVLDVEGTEVVIDYLEYDLQEGFAVWHTDPDAPATVEIVVTLTGTEGFGSGSLPYRIGSFDSWATFTGQDVRADVPTWSTEGELRLNRAGAFRLDRDAIESITVDVIVALASDPGDPVTIPIE